MIGDPESRRPMTDEEKEKYQKEVRELRGLQDLYVLEASEMQPSEDPDEETLAEVRKAVHEGRDVDLIEILKAIDYNARNWGIAHGKMMTAEDWTSQVEAELLYQGEVPVGFSQGTDAIIGEAIGFKQGDKVEFRVRISGSHGRDIIRIMKKKWPVGLVFTMIRPKRD